MDWVVLDFPSIDATPGLRLINSHLEKNFAAAESLPRLSCTDPAALISWWASA